MAVYHAVSSTRVLGQSVRRPMLASCQPLRHALASRHAMPRARYPTGPLRSRAAVLASSTESADAGMPQRPGSCSGWDVVVQQLKQLNKEATEVAAELQTTYAQLREAIQAAEPKPQLIDTLRRHCDDLGATQVQLDNMRAALHAKLPGAGMPQPAGSPGFFDTGDRFPVEGAYISKFLDVLKLQDLGIDPPTDKAVLHERLCIMQLAKDIGGPEPVLTVAGLLLLGPSRGWQAELPQCSGFLIRVLVCNDDDPPGTPDSECTTLAPREYLMMGNAPQQINQAVAFIDGLTGLEYEMWDTADLLSIAGAPRGIQRRQYPVVAIRELIVNAVVHRSYFMARGRQVTIKVRHRSLEITSPGELLPGLTPEALGTEFTYSWPRNVILSWFMHKLTDQVQGGWVFAGHGDGIAHARRLIHSYGGSLTFQEHAAPGAVMAMVTAGKSPVPIEKVQ